MYHNEGIAHPRNTRGVKALNQPVAISIPGVGLVCYLELSALPKEVFNLLEAKMFDLERELERRTHQLNSLKAILQEGR